MGKVQDLINYAHCRQKSKQPIKMVKGGIKFNSEVMKHFKVSVAPAKENFTTARLKLIRYEKSTLSHHTYPFRNSELCHTQESSPIGSFF